jgi:hypothetical protein
LTTAALAKAMLFLLSVYMLVNQYVPNSLGLSQSLYAGTEYVVLSLIAIWPLTWIEDARAVRDPSATPAALERSTAYARSLRASV